MRGSATYIVSHGISYKAVVQKRAYKGSYMLDDVSTITLHQPDDWHVHLRDGAMLATVVSYTARQFARAIIAPSLVTSANQGRLSRTLIS